MKSILRGATALTAVVSLLQPIILTAAAAETGPITTVQPGAPKEVAAYIAAPSAATYAESGWTAAEVAALRSDIKYVFVIFNENRSFDHEYGTFPGANGIYADKGVRRAAKDTPGFTQTYVDLNGATQTITPFLLGPEQNSTFHDSTDHSHTGLATKLDVKDGVPQMDQFSYDEYHHYAKTGNAASQAEGFRFSQLVMSHVDCNTIPFFWRWASNFALFDNIFATEDTPSSPNAIAMIAGQSGETQWVKHPTAAYPGGDTATVSGTINGLTYSGTATTSGAPIVSDYQPWWGSEFDTTTTNREPTSPKEFYGSGGTSVNIASNLTFATVPLTLMGGWIDWFTNQDQNASFDLADISNDIPYIKSLAKEPVQWRWYQNGYDQEPTDDGSPASHKGYVSHHNGPQYFGYIANNPSEQTNLRGENDLFTDLANNTLPSTGGVFYLRGGYYNMNYPTQTAIIQNSNYPNTAGLTPTELSTIAAAKSGDDDHPSYSDSQLSESMAARAINAIAANKEIWEHSAIIITYDESDGLYDHVPPRILSYGPDSLPLARGVRIPLMLISPYAKSHIVSHAEGDHNAVIETINAIFGLPALASLPDEAAALTAGNSEAFNAFGPSGFEQKYLGPRDKNSAITDSLLSAFDKNKVLGMTPRLPASLAITPTETLNSYPHYAGKGCSALGITPEDVKFKINDAPPAGFNTLPSTLPAYN